MNGEITGTHFSSLARSANFTSLTVSPSTEYYYDSSSVDADFCAFLEANMKTNASVNASGRYQGQSFNYISFVNADSGTANRIFLVSSLGIRFLTVYTKGVFKKSYVAFNKDTTITYNGQTFSSDQDKYKMFKVSTAIKDSLNIIQDKGFSVAKGTIQCGDITITGTEDAPINVKVINGGTTTASYVFSKDGTLITVNSSYNNLPFSISLDLFENLQGIKATNIYRGNAESSIGTAKEPFDEIHASDVFASAAKISGWQVTDESGVLTFTYKG